MMQPNLSEVGSRQDGFALDMNFLAISVSWNVSKNLTVFFNMFFLSNDVMSIEFQVRYCNAKYE